MLLRLRTSQEALDVLEERQVKVHVADTKVAAEIYNGLVKRGELVGGLFHSTC